MKSLFAIIFSVICCASAAPLSSEQEKLDCFIFHLKSKDNLGFDVPANQTIAQHPDCLTLIQALTEDFFLTAADSIRHIKFDEHLECIIEQLKQHSWVDYTIQQLVYEHTEAISKEDSKKLFAKAEKMSEMVFVDATRFCVGDKRFKYVVDEME